MELKEFFCPDQYDTDRWECKRCGALVGNLLKHYNWHHSVDSVATTEVTHYAASHTRP
jgi:hypothetical protein